MWRTALDQECWVRQPPIAHGAQVVARCGSQVIAFDADTGAVVWTAELGAQVGDGVLFARCGTIFITDISAGDDPTTTLVGIADDGSEQWRTSLPIVLLRRNARAGPDRIVAFGRGPDSGPSLHTISAATGQVIAVEPAPDGTSGFADVDGLRLFANRNPAPGEHSLLLSDGATRRAIDQVGGVWTLRATAGTVVTVARTDDGGHRLEARELPSGDLRWAHPCIGEAADIADEFVAFMTGSEDEPIPTLCDLATGEVRWTGEPLPEVATFTVLAGDLIIVALDLGCVLYRRDSPTPLGESEWELSYGVLHQRDRLYFGDYRAVACVDATDPLAD